MEIKGICLSSQDLRKSNKSNIEEMIINKALFQTKIYIIYTELQLWLQHKVTEKCTQTFLLI
jgi:hypothetical protein